MSTVALGELTTHSATYDAYLQAQNPDPAVTSPIDEHDLVTAAYGFSGFPRLIEVVANVVDANGACGGFVLTYSNGDVRTSSYEADTVPMTPATLTLGATEYVNSVQVYTLAS